MEHRLRDAVTVLLLPAYFAFTGLRTRIGLLEGAEHWLLCGLIVAAATLGKFGGTFLPARLTGGGWRDSTALGVLMNTRGLMELVVLNVGLDLGVISPALFAMMVVMALATTVATGPVLSLLGVDTGGHGAAIGPSPHPQPSPHGLVGLGGPQPVCQGIDRGPAAREETWDPVFLRRKLAETRGAFGGRA